MFAPRPLAHVAAAAALLLHVSCRREEPRAELATAPGRGDVVGLAAERGEPAGELHPFPGATHGVELAAGNVGASRLLVAPGPSPHAPGRVRGIGLRGAPTLDPGIDWIAFGPGSRGATLDAGNLDGMAGDEVVTGPGPGSAFGPQVRSWRYRRGRVTPIAGASFIAFPTASAGVVVATGDVDGDGFAEILAAPGPAAPFGAQVRAWDHDGVGLHLRARFNFFPFPTRHGTVVRCGDADLDGYDEVAVAPGPDPNATAQVSLVDYDATALVAMPGGPPALPFRSRYGARLDLGNPDPEGRGRLAVGAGPDPTADGRVGLWTYDAESWVQTSGRFAAPSGGYGARVAILGSAGGD